MSVTDLAHDDDDENDDDPGPTHHLLPHEVTNNRLSLLKLEMPVLVIGVHKLLFLQS